MADHPPAPPTGSPDRERLRLEIRGAVQGVGFRPTVYRHATELGLDGWVINDTSGVRIELEGPRGALEAFVARLRDEPPPRAIVTAQETAWLPAVGLAGFEIRHSDGTGPKSVAVLPDLAPCADCMADVANAADRRHGYPFTNCTHCGPRFTIVRALPYDRPNTTMAGFAMCPECRREYADPRDRRFHAQPTACPACGPRVALWSDAGAVLAEGEAAWREAAAAIRAGRIVAVKGLGGFQLACDARDTAAVARLRERKAREEKPFAVMVRDLAAARALVHLDAAAEAVLASPEAPIVLAPRREGAALASGVAPGLPTLGVMLPSTPLHHLLLAALDAPVIATSGNRHDEPIVTDEREALERLAGIADLLLVHDRPIERHCDDSVGWMREGGLALLRRARGYAPLPLPLARDGANVLGVGAHLKGAVALAVGPQAFVSQHLGDLETPQAVAAFERVIADFERLYEAAPAAIAHDLHPDYAATQWAKRAAAARGVPLVGVQHHHAHLAACLAEHGEPGRALGITWDGTGYGTDGTIWGGECLLGDAAEFARVAALRPFRLPGGDAAVREPRRTALALLAETLGEAAFARTDVEPVASFGEAERGVLARMIATGAHAPVTTSAGRIFDGLASLLGLRQRAAYEGQAAIALEFAADGADAPAYPVPVAPRRDGVLEMDWRPLVAAVLDDLARGRDRASMAAAIHASLAGAIADVASRVGERRVALSGGCFQNRRLADQAAGRLRAAGHEVLQHRRVPPNDGGIAYGQVAVARARGIAGA